MKLALLPVLFAAVTASASPCSSREHRAFDFWIGDWRVETADGRLAGYNTVRVLHDRCVIAEQWRGVHGMTGSSFSIYDAASRRWHQTWVDGNGLLLLLDGSFVNEAMMLAGVRKLATGETVHERITWSRLPHDRVRQLWERSTDSANTWKVIFDGTYIARCSVTCARPQTRQQGRSKERSSQCLVWDKSAFWVASY